MVFSLIIITIVHGVSHKILQTKHHNTLKLFMTGHMNQQSQDWDIILLALYASPPFG